MDRLAYWKQRCRDAENAYKYAERSMESNRGWMSQCHNEERRLRDRCAFLYGAAIAHGAVADDLRAEWEGAWTTKNNSQ